MPSVLRGTETPSTGVGIAWDRRFDEVGGQITENDRETIRSWLNFRGPLTRGWTWEASAGTGAVYSWTTVWRPQMPTFEVPYVAIIVDMDEGWQILSNLIGCEHDAVEIGMRVAVEFHEMEGGFTLPYFRPA